MNNMIVDKLENASFYMGADPRIAAGLRLLQETDFSGIEPGYYEVEGKKLCYWVEEKETRPVDNNNWEAHLLYADIQYILQGEEDFGFVNVEKLTSRSPYNIERDIRFFSGEGNFVRLFPGDFAIQFLHDAHLPDSSFDAPSRLRKVVVKMLWKDKIEK